MRVVLVSADAPETCILRDVHYASAPATMARIRQDVGCVLAQHGLSQPAAAAAGGGGGGEEEQELVKTHGVLRVTSGKEAPGVQILARGRVVLFTQVVWEGRATDEEGAGERIGEAARMGDWLVFVLELPSVRGLLMPPPPPTASIAGLGTVAGLGSVAGPGSIAGPGSVVGPGSARGSRAPSAAGSPAASSRGSHAPGSRHSGSVRASSEHPGENGAYPRPVPPSMPLMDCLRQDDHC